MAVQVAIFYWGMVIEALIGNPSYLRRPGPRHPQTLMASQPTPPGPRTPPPEIAGLMIRAY